MASKKKLQLKLKHPNTVAAHLDAAADYLEDAGWCTGELKDADGRVCALGAINAVTLGDKSLRESVYCTFAKYLNGANITVNAWNAREYSGERRVVHQDKVASWNDHLSRKSGAKVVKSNLRKCAEFVRKNAIKL